MTKHTASKIAELLCLHDVLADAFTYLPVEQDQRRVNLLGDILPRFDDQEPQILEQVAPLALTKARLTTRLLWA